MTALLVSQGKYFFFLLKLRYSLPHSEIREALISKAAGRNLKKCTQLIFSPSIFEISFYRVHYTIVK